jgi:hypothetical protein
VCSRFSFAIAAFSSGTDSAAPDLKITMANMAEKEEFEVNAQHVETNSDHLSDEKDVSDEKDLSKVQTLGIVDVENKAAYKGDDSDGQVEWNFRNLAAATFLCMLYTGTLTQSLAVLQSAAFLEYCYSCPQPPEPASGVLPSAALPEHRYSSYKPSSSTDNLQALKSSSTSSVDRCNSSPQT